MNESKQAYHQPVHGKHRSAWWPSQQGQGQSKVDLPESGDRQRSQAQTCRNCGRLEALPKRHGRCTACAYYFWRLKRERQLSYEREIGVRFGLAFRAQCGAGHQYVLGSFYIYRRRGKTIRVCRICRRMRDKRKTIRRGANRTAKQIERSRRCNANRRNRVLGISSDLSPAQWEHILNAANGKCYYCGKKRKLTMDHVIALANGGQHTASNIVAACLSCNDRKGTRRWLLL